jgi:SEC-C motif-containing protein
MKPDAAAPCPCGNDRKYANCCGEYHTGGIAPTAEALMRSRYSAYVLGLEPYLLDTWHASTRPQSLDLAQDTATRWLGLEIKHHEPTGPGRATVEFVARYKVSGRAHRLHEISRFLREDGRWYYLDGKIS